MKKPVILIIILLLILAVLIGVLLMNLIGSEEDQSLNEYSYTKAICDGKNYCQDHEIVCKNKEVVSVTPITGASVQFSKNWQDPRAEDTKEVYCE